MATDSQILNYLLASVIAEKRKKLPSEILREARQYYEGADAIISEERIRRFNLRTQLVKDGCSQDLVRDYLAIRKDKKMTNTEGAYTMLKKEADKAGITVPQAISICTAHNWAGFKAEWLQNGNIKVPKQEKSIFQT